VFEGAVCPLVILCTAPASLFLLKNIHLNHILDLSQTLGILGDKDGLVRLFFLGVTGERDYTFIGLDFDLAHADLLVLRKIGFDPACYRRVIDERLRAFAPPSRLAEGASLVSAV